MTAVPLLPSSSQLYAFPYDLMRRILEKAPPDVLNRLARTCRDMSNRVHLMHGHIVNHFNCKAKDSSFPFLSLGFDRRGQNQHYHCTDDRLNLAELSRISVLEWFRAEGINRTTTRILLQSLRRVDARKLYLWRVSLDFGDFERLTAAHRMRDVALMNVVILPAPTLSQLLQKTRHCAYVVLRVNNVHVPANAARLLLDWSRTTLLRKFVLGNLPAEFDPNDFYSFLKKHMHRSRNSIVTLHFAPDVPASLQYDFGQELRCLSQAHFNASYRITDLDVLVMIASLQISVHMWIPRRSVPAYPTSGRRIGSRSRHFRLALHK